MTAALFHGWVESTHKQITSVRASSTVGLSRFRWVTSQPEACGPGETHWSISHWCIPYWAPSGWIVSASVLVPAPSLVVLNRVSTPSSLKLHPIQATWLSCSCLSTSSSSSPFPLSLSLSLRSYKSSLGL